MNNATPALSQLGQRVFLTDGGLETTLIYHEGIDLPEFASFVLLESDDGIASLRNYYRRYLDIAVGAGCGFVLEAPTWRANRDWGRQLQYDEAALCEVNERAIRLLHQLREEYAATGIPIVISGNIGPRGDGYVAGEAMSIGEAAAYHELQVAVFLRAGADIVTAMTMTYAEEAAGVVTAATRNGLPSVIGFTTETDGRLPNGLALEEAIGLVDRETGGGPAYYMVNCAHPDHFSDALGDGAGWSARIRAVRANASRRSHAELDAAKELDTGDVKEFGQLHRRLRRRFPQLSVFGGCCGTDHRHVAALTGALA
jgi:S-methylmethionine-dependent homocysteine/selenocysteine methylase